MQETPYWWDAAPPALEETALPDHTPVAIVGGGYTGLSASLTLSRLGHRATVLDGERIGWGASSRNGGMVSGGIKVAGSKHLAALGPEGAKRVALDAAASLGFLEETLMREAIDCDYRRVGRFSPAYTAAHLRAMEQRAPFLQEVTGLPVRIVPRAAQESELGSRFYRGGMVVEASGGLHPGKYVRGLAQAAARAGATLIGGTRVTGFRREGGGWRIATNRGEMRADAVLMATNGYTAGGPMPYLSRRLLPVASYIIATEQMDPATIRTLFPTMRMISDSRRVLSYFRPSPDGTRILWGGRASFSDITATQAAPVLARMMANVFPRMRGVRLTHAWRGNVAFTFDFLPHLGVQNGIHYAAGCQGSGVAMMSWMGHQAALAMAGRGNARFSFAEMTMPTMPGYGGRPWFLPMVGGWYRLRDWWDRRRDG